MRISFDTTNLFLTSALCIAAGLPPSSTQSQTYPIDCAILLCLAGGWPASQPCDLAHYEFIRRITPWPVDPPLQIWRCPMGAAHESEGQSSGTIRVFDALLRTDDIRSRRSLPMQSRNSDATTEPVIWVTEIPRSDALLADVNYHRVQDGADIDISGPEFNFVRSIRIFDVRYAQQHRSNQDGDCNRSSLVVLGTYGTQGDFSWQSSSYAALPPAHVGLEQWGQNCPNIYHRSVFVDWRDYEGNYGFEQVNY